MKVLVVLLTWFIAQALSKFSKKPLDSAVKTSLDITHGTLAAEGQFPYQVGLSFYNSTHIYWCGGSLIGQNWVLTAAHCISSNYNIMIIYGSIKRNKPRLYYIVKDTDCTKHPKFDPVTNKNDIALIKSPSVAFTDYINKVELPPIDTKYPSFEGQEGYIAGWGKTSDSDPATYSNDLYFSNFTVVPNKICVKRYGSKRAGKKTMCIGTPGGTSLCLGDSGGALVHKVTRKLIGIASFASSKGCEIGDPVVLNRVTAYLDWIKSISGIFYPKFVNRKPRTFEEL